MTKTVPPPARTLAVVLLAPLLLAAGNVNVKRSNGKLILLGDAQDNHVAVDQVGPEAYLVSGQNSTTIDGVVGAKLFEGVTRDLIVVLRRGDDVLSVDGDVDGRVRISTGPGDDAVDLEDGFVDRSLSVVTASGNDVVDVNVEVREAARVVTGPGDDQVDVFDAEFLGKARIVTGPDDDLVQAVSTFVTDLLLLRLGGGDDDLLLSTLSGDTVRANGGGGFDALSDQGGHALDQGPFATKFETD